MDNSRIVEIDEDGDLSDYFNLKASKTNSYKISPSFIDNIQGWHMGE